MQKRLMKVVAIVQCLMCCTLVQLDASENATTAKIFQMYGKPYDSEYAKQKSVVDKIESLLSDIEAERNTYIYAEMSSSIYTRQHDDALVKVDKEIAKAKVKEKEVLVALDNQAYMSPDSILATDVAYRQSIENIANLNNKRSLINEQLTKVIYTAKDTEINSKYNETKDKLKYEKNNLKNAKDYSVIGDFSNLRIPTSYGSLYVTSPFGYRIDPITNVRSFHNGLDLRSPVGSKCYALFNGTVEFAGVTKGGGNTIIIDHGDGISTAYLHLSELLINKGDKVAQYDLIALTGNTGRSTGPHLHLGLYINGEPVDPYLLWRNKEW